MTTILAQVAPQRSTQYADLARTLAIPELQLSPLGAQATDFAYVTLGGQDYVRFVLPREPTSEQLRELSMLAMTSAFFIHYDQIGDVKGPLLRPLESDWQPTLPPDLVATRRYRGKTNELFTHFLCNVARYSSAFADQPWHELTLMDPLMGGGTTLFVGLMLGAQKVGGMDSDTEDVRSTATFLQQYFQSARISHKMQPERLKGLGLRWHCTIGKKHGDRSIQECIMANGDTVQTQTLLPGFKPHLIVADLPYGVQHQGQLNTLLLEALPGWLSMLRRGGVIVLAWDATRFTRTEMLASLGKLSHLAIRNQPPYDSLAHSVDRVIKARDVLVLTQN
ncbi:MAG: hypothetical protein KDE58_02380 [Caldilineaceae bacterium]|nr:hypothetical protein [Caldilineaceae bacterium]